MSAQKQIGELKEEFYKLLRSTKREGMESLITWLNESDFFTAPASTVNHGAYEGGLANHSMNVYKLLVNFNKNIKCEHEDALIIAGLLHDVCKVNLYVKGIKNVKTNGRWSEKEVYMVEDTLPVGHGEKSVFLLMKHIALTDEEAVAIRWHMSGYDDAARSYIGGLTQSNAYRAFPLAPGLAIADMYATYFAD
ncbi:MAG: HD domain-containing protein [Christensenella sp.]